MARASFKHPYTYIVRDAHRAIWYLVEQTSAKGWVAMSFAQFNNIGFEDRIRKGNGTSLYKDIMKDNATFLETTDQKRLRQGVYNVCKYGELYRPEN